MPSPEENKQSNTVTSQLFWTIYKEEAMSDLGKSMNFCEGIFSSAHLGHLGRLGTLHVECPNLVIKQWLDLSHRGASGTEGQLLHMAHRVIVVHHTLACVWVGVHC